MWKNIKCGIYCIENKETHKKYIGQSINIYYRWSKHKGELNNHIHDNDYLQKAWDKYGQECFDFYILEECDVKDLDTKEIYYINYYDTLNHDKGYNLKYGGQDGVVGEYGNNKRKQSLKKAYQNPDLIELRRNAALKQWSNPDIKIKIMGQNNVMYGKTHSEEARKKISEAQKGRISPQRNTTPVLCVELNKFFSCSAEAKKELNINSSILEVCKGKRKTAGGYHWQFVMENNI